MRLQPNPMKEPLPHIPFINQKIKLSDLHIDRSCRLGNGSYGYVYRGELHYSPVAVKEIVIPARNKHSMDLLLTDEVKISELVRHPSIVQFMGYTFDLTSNTKCMFLVYELVDGDNVEDIIYDSDKHALHGFHEIGKKCDILYQISQALAYLHMYEPKIVHGDVKPSNIMVTRNGRVKILDSVKSSRTTQCPSRQLMLFGEHPSIWPRNSSCTRSHHHQRVTCILLELQLLKLCLKRECGM